MKNIIITIVIGLIAGGIDVLPMIKMKQDKNSIASAFVFYFIVPFIIYSTNFFGIIWWMKGAVITLLLAVPILLLAIKSDKKAGVPIMINSIVLGTLIGIAGHFINIY